MALRQLLRLLLARSLAIVACAAVGAASAFLASTQLPTVYEAKASLIAQTMASTYAEVAKSTPVLEYAQDVLARRRVQLRAAGVAVARSHEGVLACPGSVDGRTNPTLQPLPSLLLESLRLDPQHP